jgi:2-polyprenyl-3-methyl-5-hydroxy-6-metoxy-1,4-benzoquinol methylase
VNNLIESLTEHAKREANYFDKAYSVADTNQKASGYIVPQRFIKHVTNPRTKPLSDREYSMSILGTIEGKKLLDYGAGDGWNTICFAKAKAKVWAIDMSEKGIELIKKKAIANDVSNLVSAEVQDCYKTQFPTNMFDVIYGSGILHHLELEAAGREISRILNPDGVAVFYEPIRENRIMEFIKAFVLRITKIQCSEETEDEIPLNAKKIMSFNKHFDYVRYRQFNVVTTASKFLKSDFIKSNLFLIDALLMKIIPGFKKLGMAAVIELRQPKKRT